LALARERTLEAAKAGAGIIVLPECFNSPYGTLYFPKYAEKLLPSPPLPQESLSFHALSQMAADAGIYLVGGSIPEFHEGKYYNTCLVFSPKGDLLATHRKIHLVDIDIPGKIAFKESETISPGSSMTVVDVPEYGKLGVGICYDIRFPEITTIAARNGCFAMVFPAAFTMPTGSLHWALLARSRAVDNQMYIIMCSPARNSEASYVAWGHSMVVDPMATAVSEADENETIVYAQLHEKTIRNTRQAIPVYSQRRFDVYKDISV
jgi:omega-amidase